MNNKQIVIFGDTIFSEELKNIISLECGNDKVIAFTIDSKYKKSEEFCGLPIYPFEQLEQYIDVTNTEILLTIGYNNMNQLRKVKYEECKSRGFMVHTYISQKAIVYSDKIGEGCIIMPGVYIGPFCMLGNCNIIKACCSLPHHINIGNFNWIAGGCSYGGDVLQGNNCFVGIGSTIRNGISIADKTFVGAHSYLSSDSIYEGAYVGSPAKIISGKKSVEIITRV